ncbi:MAG: response regulator [Lentisphaerota bacterium]
MKISKKLILSWSLIVFVILAVIVVLVSINTSDALTKAIGLDLQGNCEFTAKDIDTFMNQREKELKILSQADDVFATKDSARVNTYLTKVLKESDGYTEFIMVDLDGKIFADTRSLNMGVLLSNAYPELVELYEKAKHIKQSEALFRNAYLNKNNNDNLETAFITPITDASDIKVIDVLIGVISIDKFKDQIVKLDDLTVGNKSSYLVDVDGKVLCVGNSDTEQKVMTTHKDVLANPDLQKLLSGNVNGWLVYKDSVGDMVLAGYADLKEYGINKGGDWSIVSVARTSEILAPAIDLRNQLIIIGIIALLIAVGFSFLISRAIAKPIVTIVKAVQDLAKGKNVKVDIKTKDEIGTLAASFNATIDSINEVASAAQKVANGDTSVSLNERSEEDELCKSFNKMTSAIREQTALNKKKEWAAEGFNKLNTILREEKESMALGEKICSFLADFLGIQIAALYIANENKLKLSGSYAFSKRKQLGNEIELGEGITGQAGLEKKTISIIDVPKDYTRINSALGSSLPLNIVAVPFVYINDLIGVVEIGSFKEISDDNLEFLKAISEPVAIGFVNLKHKEKIQTMLELSQQQSEELQAQQEELRAANEELETQMAEINKAKDQLQSQQEELKSSNEELEEKSEELEKQKKEIEKKNNDLTLSEMELVRKSNDLQLSNKYKSEFLANMSHELRTPLNSMLLLSNKFATNKEGNLTEKQVRNAEIIYNSGKDLLKLISEILDLAKVESGKMDVVIESLSLDAFKRKIKDNFEHMIKEKNLSFNIELDSNLPATIKTDAQKLEQIVKNLLSNSIKFTSTGSITVNISRASKDNKFKRTGINPKQYIAISVTDTGIGIQDDKKNLIFEAFKQADGSTSRVYGGTGLGLSISKEFAIILGGEITIESKVGKGSIFTLYIPEDLAQGRTTILAAEKAEQEPVTAAEAENPVQRTEKAPEVPRSYPSIPDDRASIKKGDNVILIIEDDQIFAQVLYDICKEKGYSCLHATEGAAGFKLAQEYQPIGILLDIYLPESNGLDILDKLKDNLATRHIPIHILSGEDQSIKSMQKGAISFIKKPVDKQSIDEAFKKIVAVNSGKTNKILLIEDNKNQCHAIKEILDLKNISIDVVNTGNDGIKKLESEYYDLIILDLDLPDISGFEVMEKVKSNSKFKPIIVYTGKELSPKEKATLAKYSASTILKVSESAARLLDEVSLFLHTETNELSDDKKKILQDYHTSDAILEGKTVLVVDDDVRNLYLLEEELKELNLKVLKAANGRMAIDALMRDKNIDLVLMDIMMPIMDGYQAMEAIRKDSQISSVPIIALTAKAMSEDRQKCIKAGANDYLTKPVDMNKLTTLMKVWIKKHNRV